MSSCEAPSIDNGAISSPRAVWHRIQRNSISFAISLRWWSHFAFIFARFWPISSIQSLLILQMAFHCTTHKPRAVINEFANFTRTWFLINRCRLRAQRPHLIVQGRGMNEVICMVMSVSRKPLSWYHLTVILSFYESNLVNVAIYFGHKTSLKSMFTNFQRSAYLNRSSWLRATQFAENFASD